MLFLIAPCFRAVLDWHTIEVQKQPINYFRMNIVSEAIIAIEGVIALILGLPALHPPAPWEVVAVAISTYWMCFDYSLNILREKPVLQYYGNFNDLKNLSFVEYNVYRHVSWKVLLAAKLILFFTSLTFYML